MKLSEIKQEFKTHKPSDLRVSTVYRTEKADSYYKGKTIWGKGKYFSLSKEDAEKINSGGEIQEYHLPDSLRLLEFDLTWRNDRKRSDTDYELLHSLIDNVPPRVDGYVIRSHSLQYGFSQVVIFPHAIKKVTNG